MGDGPTESSPGGRLASNVSTWRIDTLIGNSIEGYRKTEHHLSKKSISQNVGRRKWFQRNPDYFLSKRKMVISSNSSFLSIQIYSG